MAGLLTETLSSSSDVVRTVSGAAALKDLDVGTTGQPKLVYKTQLRHRAAKPGAAPVRTSNKK